MSTNFDDVVARFPGKNVLVLGDVMLDHYIWGRVSRISPEAPIPVVEVERVSYMPGGAANVAANIAALGGNVYLAGVVGAHETGVRLKTLIRGANVIIDGLKVDGGRPTTMKTRIIAHNQQVVRVDHEHRRAIAEPVVQSLLNYILDTLSIMDVLLISDYAKGVTVPPLVKRVIHAAREHGKPVVVDPKGCDFSKYTGATIITPNTCEAAIAGDMEISDEASLVRVGQRLLHQIECEMVIISRSDQGMSVFERNGNVHHLPVTVREVYDVAGAGDTVVGTLALALSTGAQRLDCARIANHAAGIVVGKVGTALVTVEDLRRLF
jgi:D-beta-D-heptose 7-phosphate kinase/D-beta-D-heptose 1-phosphate adenosyltransferase